VYVTKLDTSIPCRYEIGSANFSEKLVLTVQSDVLTELLVKFGVLEMKPCYWQFISNVSEESAV
jgi:hypothetical protein